MKQSFCSVCSKPLSPWTKSGFCPPHYNGWYRAQPGYKKKHAEYERQRRARLGSEYAERERARDRKAWRSAYYASHKAEAAAAQRLYRLRHRDKTEARWAKWYAENPEKVRLKGVLRTQNKRAAIAGVERSLTREEWIAIKDAYQHRCAYCGNHFDRLCQDHVIPISKGGGHTMDNIVPACRSCNSKKSNRAPHVPLAKRMILI